MLQHPLDSINRWIWLTAHERESLMTARGENWKQTARTHSLALGTNVCIQMSGNNRCKHKHCCMSIWERALNWHCVWCVSVHSNISISSLTGWLAKVRVMWVYLTREYLQAGSKPDIPPADIIANRARGNPELVGCVPAAAARASARSHIVVIIYFESSLLSSAGIPASMPGAASQRQQKTNSRPFVWRGLCWIILAITTRRSAPPPVTLCLMELFPNCPLDGDY